MTDTAIRIDNVYKKFRLYHEKRDSVYESLVGYFNRKRNYEDIDVLAGVSVDIQKGEIFGILGRNGAGKTTLLRMIAGIYPPDSGTITVDGTLIPFLQLGAGFNDELSARDNIIQYGMLLGFSKSDIKGSIDEIVGYAEVERFTDTKLKNFSSGMRTRLAFSIARRVDPDILLIDEAWSVGDLGFRQKSYRDFASLRSRNKTIVYVTHSLDEVASHCTRAMFLHNGGIRSLGSPETVVEEYRKIFT